MEAFNLLKFWRNNSPDTTADIVSDDTDSLNNSPNPALDTDDESDEDSFFDLVLNGADYCCGRDDSKSKSAMDSMMSFPESPKDVFLRGNDSNSKPQSPISLLRSAPKFRVFFLGFKKSKAENQIQKSSANEQSKRFEVEICRENSLRSKLQMEKLDDFSSSLDDSKRFPKNSVPKYLKLIKPLYSKSSKSNLSGSVTSPSPLSPAASDSFPATARRLSEERQGSRTNGFTAVRKHLVKSRSASSAAVAAATSPSARRRDDSLLEQHDGIQGAILHCKSSYSSIARGGSLLSRSVSEPYQQKSTDLQEMKRCSI